MVVVSRCGMTGQVASCTPCPAPAVSFSPEIAPLIRENLWGLLPHLDNSFAVKPLTLYIWVIPAIDGLSTAPAPASADYHHLIQIPAAAPVICCCVLLKERLIKAISVCFIASSYIT